MSSHNSQENISADCHVMSIVKQNIVYTAVTGRIFICAGVGSKFQRMEFFFFLAIPTYVSKQLLTVEFLRTKHAADVDLNRNSLLTDWPANSANGPPCFFAFDWYHRSREKKRRLVS